MKCLSRLFVTVVSLAGVFAFTACDWSSGSQENFNTSGGASVVNVSAFYQGLNGSRMVARTSRGNIVSMTIQQSGNRVDVVDNQGSTYTGTIGSPLFSGDLENGTISAGTSAATYQISFSGRDDVAGKDINFTGILTFVTLTQVNASSESTTGSSSSSSDTSTTPIVVTNPDGSTTTTTTSSSSDSAGSSSSSFTYNFAPPSSQLQLQGTWVEVDGITSTVNGVGAPATGSTFVIPVAGN